MIGKMTAIGFVTVTKPVSKGNGVYAVEVFVNGKYHDGAWGSLAEIGSWLIENNYR